MYILKTESSGTMPALKDVSHSEHRAWVSVVSGFNSGVLSLLVGHPFDTLKVRMQVDSKKKFSGQFRHLYRGIGPPLLGMGLQTAGNFGIYANSRHFFETNFFGEKSLIAVFLAGLTAGTSLAVVSLPTSLVKVQQQMSSSGLNMLQTAKRIKQIEGISGLYRGLVPHIFQAGGGRGLYLISYEIAKRWLDTKNKPELWRLVLSGGLAGFGGWMWLYPFDVVRNNIFADWKPEKQYKGTIDCFRKVYNRGGISSFYKGLQYTLIRAFPVAAVALPAYDLTQSFIYEKLRKLDPGD